MTRIPECPKCLINMRLITSYDNRHIYECPSCLRRIALVGQDAEVILQEVRGFCASLMPPSQIVCKIKELLGGS